MPHWKNNSTPAGLNTLWGDGHVVFNADSDIFKKESALGNGSIVWDPDARWDRGPGWFLEKWLEIFDRLEQ